MSMIGIGSRWPALGAIVVAASVAMPGAASAQLFFDWGGSEQKINDSGRQLVKVNIDAKPGEIVVSFTDRKLYLMTAPGQALSYPVAIPREQDRWEGKTTVTQKRENPSWTPTPTMIKENPRLPRWVPGGHPMNPLGNRALYLGSSFYRIHGTDAPWTIGTAVSKGCIRMYNKDALDVYERTKIGAIVLVTWNQYQAVPEAEQPQSLASQSAPQSAQTQVHHTSSRDEAFSQAGSSSMRQPASSSRPMERSSQALASRAKVDTRYSDVFGTSGPNDLPSMAPSEQPAAAPATAPPRQTRTREAQQPREQRRTREAAVTPSADRGEQAASGNATPEKPVPAAMPVSSPASPPVTRSVEPRQQRSAPVETGTLPEVRQPAKPSEAAEGTRTTATRATAASASAGQPDVAARALEAAERAAAAAERAAAAAERAERAATARASSAAAAVTGGSD